MKDYSALKEITVHTQKELDDIPVDFKGVIYIDASCICVNKLYKMCIAKGRSSICAFNDAVITAEDHSCIEANDNTRIIAKDHSDIIANDNARVIAKDFSHVNATGHSDILASDFSLIKSFDHVTVYANDFSIVSAGHESKITAYGNSYVVAYHFAKLSMWDSSRAVVMSDDVTVESGNHSKVRIRTEFKDVNEYADFYDIKRKENGKLILYKAASKDKNGNYTSEWKYNIDKKYPLDRKVYSLQEAIAYHRFIYDGTPVVLECEVNDKESKLDVYGKNYIMAKKLEDIRIIREVPENEWADIITGK